VLFVIFPGRVLHADEGNLAAIQKKIFLAFDAMESSPAIAKMVAQDPTLKTLSSNRVAAIKQAIATCDPNTDCTVAPFKFSDEEIAAVGKQLSELCKEHPEMKEWVISRIRNSHRFPLYEKLSDEDLIARVWTDEASAVNQIIDVYAEGAMPPANGGGRGPGTGAGRGTATPPVPRSFTLYDVKSAPYGQLLNTLARNIIDAEHSGLFFAPSMQFSVYLLDANEAYKVAAYEPLELGENAAVLKYIKTIKWDSYPYSLIMVPGKGPVISGVALSPLGKTHLRIAVARWRAKQAPIILLSGGFVHPDHTTFSEALEMKKSLIADFGIPESALMVDPYARSTATNFRNTARLIIQSGIPVTKPTLVTTDASQALGIVARTTFGRVTSISPLDIEFVISPDSMQVNWRDPLDP
jgi:hypothetical protein